MERIPLEEVRRNFDDVVNLVANAKQRFLVSLHDEDHAAIIPIEDLELLENMEQGAATVQRSPADEVKLHLGKDLAQIAEHDSRIVVVQDGDDAAALVPRRDLALLEGLDQRLRLEAAKRMLDEQIEREG